MKVYAQFLTKDLSGYLVEALGSDGVFILDGRNNVDTWKIDAMMRMHKLRNVQPDFIGYRIYKASRLGEGTLVYEWITSGTYYKVKKENK